MPSDMPSVRRTPSPPPQRSDAEPFKSRAREEDRRLGLAAPLGLQGLGKRQRSSSPAEGERPTQRQRSPSPAPGNLERFADSFLTFPAPPLDELPDNLLTHIAAHLPANDVVNFTSASTTTRALAQERQVAMVTAKATRVTTQAGFEAILGTQFNVIEQTYPSTIYNLPIALRQQPLTELLGKIRNLRPNDKPNAWHAGQAAVSRLLPEQQAEPLAALLENLNCLPLQDQVTAFDEALLAIEQLAPESRAKPLACLISSSADLLESQGLPLFDQCLAAVRTLPPQHCAEPLNDLLIHFDCLPEDEMSAACDNAMKMFNALLPKQQKDMFYSVISNVMEHLSLEDQSALFHDLLPRAADLYQENMGTGPLKGVLGQIQYFYPGDQLLAFKAGLEVAMTLPQAPREELMTVLFEQIDHMVGNEPALAFTALQDSLLTLPPAQVAQRLITLLNHLGALEEDDRLQAFTDVLNSVGQMPPEQRQELLSALEASLGDLPVDAVAQATQELNNARAQHELGKLFPTQ